MLMILRRAPDALLRKDRYAAGRHMMMLLSLRFAGLVSYHYAITPVCRHAAAMLIRCRHTLFQF